MLQRDVKYVRWRAWMHVGLGVGLTLGSLALAWSTGQPLPGLLIAFVGAVLTHVARLPLLEPGVLLCLTSTRVWTKELGWQQWADVLVYIEKNHRQSQPSSGHLVIHRPNEFTPRFFESLRALDITTSELTFWLVQYAR